MLISIFAEEAVRKQEQMFDECVEAGLRPAWTGQSPVTTQ
jgi:hypothetical protein